MGKTCICLIDEVTKKSVDFPNVGFGRLIVLDFSRETANILLYFLDGVLGHNQFKGPKESLEENLFCFPYCANGRQLLCLQFIRGPRIVNTPVVHCYVHV